MLNCYAIVDENYPYKNPGVDIGDLVRLKEGGPVMFVSSIYRDGVETRVKTQWEIKPKFQQQALSQRLGFMDVSWSLLEKV